MRQIVRLLCKSLWLLNSEIIYTKKNFIQKHPIQNSRFAFISLDYRNEDRGQYIQESLINPHTLPIMLEGTFYSILIHSLKHWLIESWLLLSLFWSTINKCLWMKIVFQKLQIFLILVLGEIQYIDCLKLSFELDSWSHHKMYYSRIISSLLLLYFL